MHGHLWQATKGLGSDKDEMTEVVLFRKARAPSLRLAPALG